MESRLLRFGRSKRDKSSPPTPGPDFQSISYDSSLASGAEPIFIHQPLGKSNRESRQLDSNQSLLLKGLPYDSQPAGKAPQFIGATPKGNGPVKLQTSRRLSSGELLVTTQHNQRTLEDIREGDYIVGQKSKYDAVSDSHQTGVEQPSRNSRFAYSLRSRPSTSRSARTNRDSNWSSMPVTPISPVRSSGLSTKSTPATSLGMMSSTETTTSPVTPAQVGSRDPAGNTPYTPSPEDTNPTIAALWKAEYGRLVKLYGHEEIDQDVLQPPKHGLVRGLSHSSAIRNTKSALISLQPLPEPGLEQSLLKRASDGSSQSSTYRDDSSDVFSPNKESPTSSWAGSFTNTAQSSVGDVESPTTRENIRKMIDGMRSNYLQAIESQSPPMIKKKSTKRRRKPRLGASPQLDTAQACPDRKTWHGQASTCEPTDDQTKRRSASHNVPTYGRLSPIEASPSRTDNKGFDASPEVTSPRDLKRADSMTLGGLMLQIPESPNEIPNETTAVDEKPAQTTATAATATYGGWLPLDLPTSTLMSDLSPKDTTTISVEELATPRYIPKTSITPRPTTAPVRKPAQLSAFPKIPPPRPAPPPMSLAEMVNFI